MEDVIVEIEKQRMRNTYRKGIRWKEKHAFFLSAMGIVRRVGEGNEAAGHLYTEHDCTVLRCEAGWQIGPCMGSGCARMFGQLG